MRVNRDVLHSLHWYLDNYKPILIKLQLQWTDTLCALDNSMSIEKLYLMKLVHFPLGNIFYKIVYIFWHYVVKKKREWIVVT